MSKEVFNCHGKVFRRYALEIVKRLEATSEASSNPRSIKETGCADMPIGKRRCGIAPRYVKRQALVWRQLAIGQ